MGNELRGFRLKRAEQLSYLPDTLPVFLKSISLACKEARETNYWLRLLKKTDIIRTSDLDDLIEESNQLIAILTTIIKKAKQNQRK